MLFQIEDTVLEIAFRTLETVLLIVIQTEEITDHIEFKIPEIKPEIAFHTVVIILWIASITVEIAVEIAFQIISKNDFMPSKIGVINSTTAFQTACIFSDIQSMTLLIMICYNKT